MTPDDAVVAVFRALDASGIPYMVEWAREAGRSKDRDDVRNMLAVRGQELDWAYIASWTERHGTAALLADIKASLPAS